MGSVTNYAKEPPADLSSLPAPPVPLDLDLRHFPTMPLDVRALRDSDMQLEVTPEEGWFAIQLWGAGWHQVPASSLPNDDAKLMYLAGLGRDFRTWKRVRKGALRGFEIHSDGRLYHRKLSKTALESHSKSRAGKRGAKTRWKDDKSLNGKECDADLPSGMTYGSTHGRDNGTSHSRKDGRGDGKTMPRREGIYPSPTPSLPTAGRSGVAGAPPDQPSTTSRLDPERDHGAADARGRVCVHFPDVAEPGQKPERLLWITPYGQVDVLNLKEDLPDLLLTRDEAQGLRYTALAYVSQGVAEDEISPRQSSSLGPSSSRFGDAPRPPD